MDGIHLVKRAHASPLLDVRCMSPTLDFTKFEEVHLLYTIWDTVLGHVVCKDGLLVDQEKIVCILDMVAPTLVERCTTLGHTGYY
jgi:hypothetical protein